ncbi:MAG TPA: hypothetical protein VEA63_08370, partial [Opitutus sp.]|nr:hypothetical protein [Opitutus sp.]
VVWPWARATGEWAEYFETKANYTMMFHGRAALPWRFTENRPVALVFAFVPEERPLTFEVRDARVVTIERDRGAEKLRR